LVPAGGYDPPANALSRRYLTIRSNGHYLAEDIGIEPIGPFLNGGLANLCRTLQHIFLKEILEYIINCD